jgi:uncharacterized protein
MAIKNQSREGRRKRGFAAMDPATRREISRRGGEASHESGRGHEFNSEEAREAGRRGGEARWGTRTSRPEVPKETAGAEDDPGVSGPRVARPRYEEEEEDLRRGPALEEAVEEGRREVLAPRERVGGRGRQGFASMNPEQQREIARRGGEASGRSRGNRAR